MRDNPLSERAMLSRLTIKRWNQQRVDRAVTEEVAIMKGADTKAGVYNKNLIDPKHLAGITKVAGKARTYHYENTLPWLDDGRRILTAKVHLKYVAEMQKLQQEFGRLTADLVAHFPGFVAAAQVTLGQMFNPGEYPTQDELAERYVFEVGIEPIPDADDFRVRLPEAELSRVREQLNQRAHEAMREANIDMWRRIFESVNHMAETLKDPGAKFKDSLVGNIRNLARIMDDMNVADDPGLTAMGEEMMERIADLDPEALRRDEGQRADAAATAREIADRAAKKMRAYGRRTP